MQRRKSNHEEGWLLSYADLITNLLLFFVVLVSASSMSASKMQAIAKKMSGEEVPQSLEEIQEQIEKKIDEEKLQGVVRTDLKDEGLDLSLDSGFVFNSGNAKIEPKMEEALASMLNVLTPYSEKYLFAVEGHTDDQPVAGGGRFRSNWELSTARAIEVRDRLEKTGVAADRIRVEGYADTKKLPEESLKGLSDEERRARHRRVVVRVY